MQSEHYRMENAMKAYQKVKRNTVNTMFKKTMAQIGEDDMRTNKLDYLLLTKQVDTLCSQIDDFNISKDQTASV